MREPHAPAGYHRASGRFLAVGGAFVTFEVFALEARVPQVCKRVRLAAHGRAEATEQLRREADVLARLKGRGAPELVHDASDEHGPYLVLEKVAGAPLSSVRLQSNELGQAARAAFSALCAMHEASDERGALTLVHGDISPSNVLLAADRARAWLVDFGLARGRKWPPTPGGAFAGTIAFAAPEHARGEPIDVRADLFAMGATLLSAALGREPRARGELPIGVQLARAGEEPLDELIDAARHVLAKGLLDAIAPCLAFEASGRPASAHVVLAALSAC